MPHWPRPKKPAVHAEQALVHAILDGTYAPGSALPGERELAKQLGVTRPTLREALQRLERDGWLSIRQGKPTLVNDFWKQGGPNVLAALARSGAALPPGFVGQLLEVRLLLAPAYTRAAIEREPGTIAELLGEHQSLPDEARAYAAFDWSLHHALTVASGNPVFTLVLNAFAGFYEEMAVLYFRPADARGASKEFYQALLTAAQVRDGGAAERITRRVMEESIARWQEKDAALRVQFEQDR